jgi:hypothetical protein
MFVYGVGPWVEGGRPKGFYEDLGMVVYWMLVMDD